MDTKTEMAVRLARKGASDDVIALVMDAMQAERASAPRVVAQAADVSARERADAARTTARGARWNPLLDAMRLYVEAHGPYEGDLRSLASKCPTAWTGVTGGELTLRGLGYMVSTARRRNETLRGMRFTFLYYGRPSNPSDTGAYAIYRVEAV